MSRPFLRRDKSAIWDHVRKGEKLLTKMRTSHRLVDVLEDDKEGGGVLEGTLSTTQENFSIAAAETPETPSGNDQSRPQQQEQQSQSQPQPQLRSKRARTAGAGVLGERARSPEPGAAIPSGTVRFMAAEPEVHTIEVKLRSHQLKGTQVYYGNHVALESSQGRFLCVGKCKPPRRGSVLTLRNLQDPSRVGPVHFNDQVCFQLVDNRFYLASSVDVRGIRNPEGGAADANRVSARSLRNRSTAVRIPHSMRWGLLPPKPETEEAVGANNGGHGNKKRTNKRGAQGRGRKTKSRLRLDLTVPSSQEDKVVTHLSRVVIEQGWLHLRQGPGPSYDAQLHRVGGMEAGMLLPDGPESGEIWTVHLLSATERKSDLVPRDERRLASAYKQLRLSQQARESGARAFAKDIRKDMKRHVLSRNDEYVLSNMAQQRQVDLQALLKECYMKKAHLGWHKGGDGAHGGGGGGHPRLGRSALARDLSRPGTRHGGTLYPLRGITSLERARAMALSAAAEARVPTKVWRVLSKHDAHLEWLGMSGTSKACRKIQRVFRKYKRERWRREFIQVDRNIVHKLNKDARRTAILARQRAQAAAKAAKGKQAEAVPNAAAAWAGRPSFGDYSRPSRKRRGSGKDHGKGKGRGRGKDKGKGKGRGSRGHAKGGGVELPAARRRAGGINSKLVPVRLPSTQELLERARKTAALDDTEERQSLPFSFARAAAGRPGDDELVLPSMRNAASALTEEQQSLLLSLHHPSLFGVLDTDDAGGRDGEDDDFGDNGEAVDEMFMRTPGMRMGRGRQQTAASTSTTPWVAASANKLRSDQWSSTRYQTPTSWSKFRAQQQQYQSRPKTAPR